jgi:hypothetical protein
MLLKREHQQEVEEAEDPEEKRVQIKITNK